MKKFIIISVCILAFLLVIGLFSSTSNLIKDLTDDTLPATSAVSTSDLLPDGPGNDTGDVPEDPDDTNNTNAFTFSIDGVKYYADEGSDWIDWCDSDYNTLGLDVQDKADVSSYEHNFVEYYDGTDYYLLWSSKSGLFVRCGDDIISGGSYTFKSESDLSTFYIDDQSYFYEKGMDWNDWIYSYYNVDGFRIDDLYVVEAHGACLMLDDQILTYDEYIGSCEYTFGYISFMIEDESFFALENMTWEEWIDSSFNTAGIFVTDNGGDGVVQHPDDDSCALHNGDRYSKPSDTIIPGHTYELYSW